MSITFKGELRDTNHPLDSVICNFCGDYKYDQNKYCNANRCKKLELIENIENYKNGVKPELITFVKIGDKNG